MKAVSGKRLCKLATRKGWELRRVTGSHHVFAKVGEKANLSIPVHGNRSLKTGTQRKLMRLAGIEEWEL